MNGTQDGHWWSRRWSTLLQELDLVEPRRPAGTAPRVRRLEVTPGQVSAQVHDRSHGPCDVTIRVAGFTQEQWQRVVDTLSTQAIFAARLLAGEMVPDIEEALAAAGISLLPASVQELDHHCSCCPGDEPCPHLVAVYRMLGEMVADDPWLLFRLRGWDEQQLLRALRNQRSRSQESPGGTRPAGSVVVSAAGFHHLREGEPDAQEAPPLELQIDDFWGTSQSREAIHHHIAPPTIELILLRRLGPPPFAQAGPEAYDRLTAIYRHITREAVALAYAADPADSLVGDGADTAR
ncbi:MAG: hypothetical protein KatS3mg050_1343 [Litorilinea sp.]|nr:MAG: hypothetical protein KatS3mg050_1343 [Litorilinea sp.]